MKEPIYRPILDESAVLDKIYAVKPKCLTIRYVLHFDNVEVAVKLSIN